MQLAENHYKNLKKNIKRRRLSGRLLYFCAHKSAENRPRVPNKNPPADYLTDSSRLRFSQPGWIFTCRSTSADCMMRPHCLLSERQRFPDTRGRSARCAAFRCVPYKGRNLELMNCKIEKKRRKNPKTLPAALINESKTDFSFSGCTQCGVHPTVFVHRSP